MAVVVSHIASRAGVGTIPSPLPRGMVLPMVRGLETSMGWFGRKLPISSAVLDEFYGRWTWYETKKAQAAFDWKPRPLRDTLDFGLQWCVERGWVQGKAAANVTKAIGKPATWD